MKPGGFVQPVADGKPQFPLVGALGPNSRHRGGVEAPQGGEHPAGLLGLVPGGAQVPDGTAGVVLGELPKAEDPLPRRTMLADVRGGAPRTTVTGAWGA